MNTRVITCLIFLSFSSIASNLECTQYFSKNISVLGEISYEDSLPWLIKNTGMNPSPTKKSEVLDSQIIRLSVPLRSKKYEKYRVEIKYEYVDYEDAPGEGKLKSARFIDRRGNDFPMDDLEIITNTLKKISSGELSQTEKTDALKLLKTKKNPFYQLREMGEASEEFKEVAFEMFEEINELNSALKEVILIDDLSQQTKKIQINFGKEKISLLPKISKKTYLEYLDFMKMFFFESKYEITGSFKNKVRQIRGLEKDLDKNPKDLRMIKDIKKYEFQKNALKVRNSSIRILDRVIYYLIGSSIATGIVVAYTIGKNHIFVESDKSSDGEETINKIIEAVSLGSEKDKDKSEIQQLKEEVKELQIILNAKEIYECTIDSLQMKIEECELQHSSQSSPK